MGRGRSYTDQGLREAVADNHSWRGVLRALGLSATSSAAIRSVRQRADELRCDYSHFRGQRTWSERELADAVASARTWHEVADRLGLAGGSSQTTIRGHVARLGIDASHLRPPSPRPDGQAIEREPSREHLPRAGSLLAAAWFALCGDRVSWPLEPCRYDLLVERDGAVERVQVKTATVRAGSSWTVWLSTTGRIRSTYDIDDIDSFFVIDGDLGCYLIPVATVGGLHAVNLAAYSAFRVRAGFDAGGGLGPLDSAGPH